MRQLTGKTDGADVSDVNQTAMAEACGTVVDLHPRRQGQLGPRGSVGQKYPLCACEKPQHENIN